jgi:hypothetical protein
MYIMDLLKYSILKLNISPILKDKSGRDEYHLEGIKKIDGNLLRKTFTIHDKDSISINKTNIQIKPQLMLQLFNNIKTALSYKFNDITQTKYTTPVQTLEDHYISMLSYKIFKVSNLLQPFKNQDKLKKTIEEKIDEMIYRFLDVETYTDINSYNELIKLLNKDTKHFILNFQCVINPPTGLNKYNIHPTVWNINVLID